jgi:hypothetical protein
MNRTHPSKHLLCGKSKTRISPGFPLPDTMVLWMRHEKTTLFLTPFNFMFHLSSAFSLHLIFRLQINPLLWNRRTMSFYSHKCWYSSLFSFWVTAGWIILPLMYFANRNTLQIGSNKIMWIYAVPEQFTVFTNRNIFKSVLVSIKKFWKNNQIGTL